MYIIQTSVLPANSKMVLADPRSESVDNINGTTAASWSQQKAAVTGGNRRLTYYYPTSKDSSAKDYLAPKFRVASSYGATQPVTYDDAFRRCASYQEDGYPAGRWRVPTKAEIEFMMQLTTDGMIPRLFGSNNGNGTSPYWVGSGYVTVYDGNQTTKPYYTEATSASESVWVRCVYDEWYWENTQYARLSNKGTFTWGDQTRESVVRTKAAE